ncbi:WH2 domain-containing protein [Spongorhabdus nitratireducens]
MIFLKSVLIAFLSLFLVCGSSCLYAMKGVLLHVVEYDVENEYGCRKIVSNRESLVRINKDLSHSLARKLQKSEEGGDSFNRLALVKLDCPATASQGDFPRIDLVFKEANGSFRKLGGVPFADWTMRVSMTSGAELHDLRNLTAPDGLKVTITFMCFATDEQWEEHWACAMAELPKSCVQDGRDLDEEDPPFMYEKLSGLNRAHKGYRRSKLRRNPCYSTLCGQVDQALLSSSNIQDNLPRKLSSRWLPIALDYILETEHQSQSVVSEESLPVETEDDTQTVLVEPDRDNHTETGRLKLPLLTPPDYVQRKGKTTTCDEPLVVADAVERTAGSELHSGVDVQGDATAELPFKAPMPVVPARSPKVLEAGREFQPQGKSLQHNPAFSLDTHTSQPALHSEREHEAAIEAAIRKGPVPVPRRKPLTKLDSEESSENAEPNFMESWVKGQPSGLVKELKQFDPGSLRKVELEKRTSEEAPVRSDSFSGGVQLGCKESGLDVGRLKKVPVSARPSETTMSAPQFLQQQRQLLRPVVTTVDKGQPLSDSSVHCDSHSESQQPPLKDPVSFASSQQVKASGRKMSTVVKPLPPVKSAAVSRAARDKLAIIPNTSEWGRRDEPLAGVRRKPSVSASKPADSKRPWQTTPVDGKLVRSRLMSEIKAFRERQHSLRHVDPSVRDPAKWRTASDSNEVASILRRRVPIGQSSSEDESASGNDSDWSD